MLPCDGVAHPFSRCVCTQRSSAGSAVLLGVLNEESPSRVSHCCNLTWFNLNFQALISLLLLTSSAFFLVAEISRISCVVWLKDLKKKKHGLL